MFEQLVDGLRWIDIAHSINTLFGFVMFVLLTVYSVIFIWTSMYRYGEAQSCPMRKKDKGCDWVEDDSLIKPGILSLIFLTLFSFSIFMGNGGIPPKEYIVMKAIAPAIDDYVSKNPDTLLKVENLAGIVDDTAKGVLDLVGDSSLLIKGYLQKQIQGAIPTDEVKK